MRNIKYFTLAGSMLLLAPALALAHPGHFGHGFGKGMVHPLSGADHILAMVAVGIWAVYMGGKARWMLPAAFLSTMILAGSLGMGRSPMPIVESGILASVLAMGLILLLAMRMPLQISAGLVAAFAFFHGYAHGAEMPATAASLTYATGFVTSTALLLGFGELIGRALKISKRPELLRYCGGAVTAGAIMLALGLI